MFRFSLCHVELCAPHHGERPDGDLTNLPTDLSDVIGTAGDQFRDWFTRLCLYLVLRSTGAAQGQTGDTVVVGTEYGNSAALTRLQREAVRRGRLLSAQYFPHATTSSASAFVNLNIGATGRNMTLNAAQLTPVMALWQALSALSSCQSTTSHLLVGDVYSAEALLDAGRGSRRSGVVYGKLLADGDLTAHFDFASQGYQHTDTALDGGRSWRVGTAPSSEPPDRNGAFAMADFLQTILTLGPAERAVLECAQPSGRRARATVTKEGRA